MESANDLLNTKLIEYKEILNKFNQEKEAKFNELEQARKNIENFLTDEVKNNPNYATLVKDLTNAKDAKKSVTKSSNKSEIIAANEALIQALADANKAKDQVDEANKSIKEQLNALIDKANTLLPQLNDNDSEIVKAKESLNAEITNANKAVNQNDNASMQSAKSSLDDKVTKIQNQLAEFNKDKDAKFKELEQTRKDIDEFINSNKDNSTYSNIISKLTTTKNEKNSVSKSSNKSDIEDANTLLKNSLQEANDKKQEIDKFVSAKKELEEFIKNDEDAKSDELVSNLNDAKQELAKFSGINDSHEITEIKKATDDLTSAKTKLKEEIKNKKQELFNAFESSKTELQNYITNDIKDSKYKIIQDKFNNVIDEYKNITSNDKISKIKEATNNLNAKFTEIGNNKAILDKFYELKPKLEDLLKTANLKDDAKSENIDLSYEEQASTDAKAINNNSTIENVEQVNQKLQAAIDKLTKDIKKINEDKKAKFEEFKTEKQHLENIIKAKGLDKFINIDEEIKSIDQQIDEEIKKHEINENSKISDILAAKDSIDQTQRKLLGLLDNYSTQRTESIDNFNKQKTELNSVINTNNFKQLEESKKTKFNNKKQEYEVLDLETLSKNKIQEKSQEIKELIDNINKEISDAKKQEYLNFDKAKKELEKYIKDELNNQKYDSIKKDAQDKINSFSAIKEESLATKEIQEIKDATTALSNAKTNAEQEKANIDAKEQLTAKIQEADKLKEELIDSDPAITTLKTNLEKEIAKANEALEKDTKAIIEAKKQLADKINEFKLNLDEFNKEKETKFKELEKTRKDINDFLTDDVKANPNYADLVKKLQNSLKTQEKINSGSNKAEIIAANNELTNALKDAKSAKTEADKANSEAKEQLNAKIQDANKLKEELIDSDSTITTLKTNLEKEIANAKEALKKDTKAIIEAKKQLADKINEFKLNLDEFNKEKETKFKELEKTRKDINDFLTDDVKANPNYADLVKKLQNSLKTQEKINSGSNKAEIIAANQALQQALQTAQSAKTEADRANGEANNKLTTSLSTANKLLEKLTDSDTDIQNYKKQLEEEIKNAMNAITSKNTKSLTDSNNSLTNKTNEIQEKLNKFIELKNKEYEKLEQTRKNIDEFIKQIENVPQTKNNCQNIIKNLKDKKIAKDSITFSNDKKEIQDANKSLQDELNNAKITKENITDFYNSKKQLEDLIKTDDAKKVGTTEADTILDHYKNISDASKNEEIKQATQKINGIKEIIKGKIEEKRRNEFSQFEQIKNELQNFINKDLKDQKYNSIRTKIENKINGVSSINKNSKIQDIENAKKQLEPAKNEFEKIINNIKKFNSQKQKIEEKLKFLDTENIGTSGSLSNKNKDIKAIFQGFINEIEKELINKKADDKAKDECINKIDFLDKALILRYEGILKAAYKFFDDTSVQKNEAEKNEFFDNLRNNLSQDKVFDQLEKMNMNHFEDFYKTFYNKGNAPLKDGKPNYDDPKYKEEINKQNELEGPAVKWSEFDDKLEDAFFWTAKTSFIKKCQNLFNNSTDKYYGTIHKTLTIYNIDIYSKTGRPNTNDLDLRNKDNIFKGYKDVTFEFSTENVPPRWQSNFKGLAKWGGSENRYRFVGIVSINSNYEYNLVTSTKGENSKKSFGLNYKLGSNDKGKDYNPIMIDRISEIN